MTVILLLVAWLLTYLLHSTVLLGGAWLLEATGVVRSNAARDTLWKAAVVGGLLTSTALVALRFEPFGGSFSISSRQESPLIDVARVPAPHRAAPPGELAGSADFAELRSGDAMGPVSAPIDEAVPAASDAYGLDEPRPLLSGVHVGFPALLLQLWLLGALAFGLCVVSARRRLMRQLHSRRFMDRGPLARMLAELCTSAGVTAPRLSVSEEVSGPITFGRGEICLPERALTSLTPLEQRAMLAHELGHVVRRDPPWLLAAAVVESVMFFQPLNRLARARLQETSEYLCDDYATALMGGGVVLARCLAEVAGWMGKSARPVLASGMAGNRSLLVARVQRLLESSPVSPSGRSAWRLSLSALGVAVVAWSVPGVTAEGLSRGATAVGVTDQKGDEWKALPVSAGTGDGEVWLSVRDGGRLIVLRPGYTMRLRGSGRLSFRQWGRGFELPEGSVLSVNGLRVTRDAELCTSDGAVSVLNQEGGTAWMLEPVALAAPVIASRAEHLERVVAEAMSHVSVRVHGHGDVAVSIDTNIADSEERLDAALDSVVEAWVNDPEAVRAAARRIARQYDRNLKPRLESLGVEVGRELAPQLERLTASLARDLTPEFARLGAELGRAIVEALGDPDALADQARPGAGDYREPKRHKNR